MAAPNHTDEDNTIDFEVLATATSLKEYPKILQEAAYENWEISVLETRVKQTNLSEKQQEDLLKFWRLNKNQIHEKIQQEVTWNNSLNKLSWRIDSKMKSKDVSDMNELTAIVELLIGTNHKVKNGENSDNSEIEAVRFEMDKSQLNKVLFQIDSIQKQLAKYT